MFIFLFWKLNDASIAPKAKITIPYFLTLMGSLGDLIRDPLFVLEIMMQSYYSSRYIFLVSRLLCFLQE